MKFTKTLFSSITKQFGLITIGAVCAVSASAQTYPTKAITLVVPFAAGGPTDVPARLIANSMSKTLGQPVVVENKLGAGGTIAANYVAKAAPDGYTFLIHHNGMGTAPALYRKLPYNPLTDFEYVSQVMDVPMTLIARKDMPAMDITWYDGQQNLPPLPANYGAASTIDPNIPAASNGASPSDE